MKHETQPSNSFSSEVQMNAFSASAISEYFNYPYDFKKYLDSWTNRNEPDVQTADGSCTTLMEKPEQI